MGEFYYGIGGRVEAAVRERCYKKDMCYVKSDWSQSRPDLAVADQRVFEGRKHRHAL